MELALSRLSGRNLSKFPPCFPLKKIAGKKLYDLAPQGHHNRKTAGQGARLDHPVHPLPTIPHLEIVVDCSKGTYIRALAHDLGQNLKCGAHLSASLALAPALSPSKSASHKPISQIPTSTSSPS